MSENLRFAVIIPVYNTSKYLPECLDSLLFQSYTNFIAFLVDDGSTDGSSTILDKYAVQDCRLRVIHKKNGGVSSARNIGLELMEKDGEFDYVLFLDSDDVWHSNCLNTVAHYLHQSDADMLAYGVQNFNKIGLVPSKGKVTHDPITYKKDEAYFFCFDNTDRQYTQSPAFSFFMGNIVIRVSAIKGLRFNASLKICEDQDFKFQAIAHINNLMVISNILMDYRLRKGSLSHLGKFNPSDMRLFLLWLKSAEAIPTSCRCMLELRLADTWWNALRVAASQGGLDQFWPEAKEVLKFMQSKFVSGIISQGKYKKRIFLFFLGKSFLHFYFNMKFRKPDFINMSNYFD